MTLFPHDIPPLPPRPHWLPRTLYRVRTVCRNAVSNLPVFIHIQRFIGSPGRKVVDARTEVVIDGFFRSGNTFAKEAFQMAAGSRVQIAHHLHASAQILEGVRRNLPILLLIRDPDDAVLSTIIYYRQFTLRQVMRLYRNFYRPLLPVLDRITVADFPEVTRNFGGVMMRLNTQFGTTFPCFEHTEENAGKCIASIERRARYKMSTASCPNQIRKAWIAELRPQLKAASLESLRQEIHALYGTITGR